MKQLKNEKMKTASDLKIGDTFKKQGYSFTVANIQKEFYKNGTPAIRVECYMNNSKVIDSFFYFKLNTKIK